MQWAVMPHIPMATNKAATPNTDITDTMALPMELGVGVSVTDGEDMLTKEVDVVVTTVAAKKKFHQAYHTGNNVILMDSRTSHIHCMCNMGTEVTPELQFT